MLVRLRNPLVTLALGVICLSAGCSNDPADPVDTGNPNSASVNEFFAGLGDWDHSVPPEKADETKPYFYYVEEGTDGGFYDWRCQPRTKNLVRKINNVMSLGMNQGVMWPGNFIQGNSLYGGNLKPVQADHAPITLVISLNSEEISRKVDNPNSVTVQQAMTDLIRQADQNIGGPDAGAIPGNVDFTWEESHSFEQSMTGMGISGGYRDGVVSLSASANANLSRSHETHTIMVRAIQEMFTIRFADDLMRTPADYFGKSVTAEALDQLRADGQIGDDNLPLYIESVTFGRVLLFTMTSESAATAASLGTAMEASAAEFSGGATLTDEQQRAMSTRRYVIRQFGGDDASAQEALATLDWTKFFTVVPVTASVPLSFRVKTLKDGVTSDIVGVVDNVLYDDRGNCRPPLGYEVTTTIQKVVLESGGCGLLGCGFGARINEVPAVSFIPWTELFPIGGGYIYGSAPVTNHYNYSETIVYDAATHQGFASQGKDFGFQLESHDELGPVHKYPFNFIQRTQPRYENRLTHHNGDLRFYYRITKTPYY
ncbi:MAG: thiol-activated cytolysin family protein [Candidatus Krumholzibacteriota bacterium]